MTGRLLKLPRYSAPVCLGWLDAGDLFPKVLASVEGKVLILKMLLPYHIISPYLSTRSNENRLVIRSRSKGEFFHFSLLLPSAKPLCHQSVEAGRHRCFIGIYVVRAAQEPVDKGIQRLHDVWISIGAEPVDAPRLQEDMFPVGWFSWWYRSMAPPQPSLLHPAV